MELLIETVVKDDIPKEEVVRGKRGGSSERGSGGRCRKKGRRLIGPWHVKTLVFLP